MEFILTAIYDALCEIVDAEQVQELLNVLGPVPIGAFPAQLNEQDNITSFVSACIRYILSVRDHINEIAEN